LNWLTPAHAFIAACALLMARRIWRIDSSSTLNRKLAICCLLSGLYELADSFLVVAPDAASFHTWLILTSTVYIVLGPIIISALFDFAAIKGKPYWLLLVPCSVLAGIQVFEVWTGTWVIVGFHPSVWGNVNELTSDALPIAINKASSLVSMLLGLGALIYAWRKASSHRYRVIDIEIFLISALVNIWGIFATGTIWMKWGLPDPTGLGVGVGLIGYSILIERYKHLSERQPDIAESLLASLSGTALFVNARGIISMAPEEAGRILGEGLVGQPLAKVLRGWPMLDKEWSLMTGDLRPRANLPGSIGGGQFMLNLAPHRNPFDEFDGAVVRLVPERKLDELGLSYSLTARELEVARLICEGHDTKQIAETLFISVATVKNHLHKLFTKTGTSGQADLVRAILSKEPGKD